MKSLRFILFYFFIIRHEKYKEIRERELMQIKKKNLEKDS